MKRKSGKALLKIEKELTYNNAGDVCADLKSALKKAADTRLVMKDITLIDLSSIQLLVSAKKTFERSGVPFFIEMDCNEEVQLLMQNCGIEIFSEPKKAS